MGWIGVDLDGTLAIWKGHFDVLAIGDPIPAMVDRVKAWIAAGQDVRIFTARVGPATRDECLAAFAGITYQNIEALCGRETMDLEIPEIWERFQRELIGCWCDSHLGQRLPITATKDFHMYQLWDDRCIQVQSNTGLTILEAFHAAAGETSGL